MTRVLNKIELSVPEGAKTFTVYAWFAPAVRHVDTFAFTPDGTEKVERAHYCDDLETRHFERVGDAARHIAELKAAYWPKGAA